MSENYTPEEEEQGRIAREILMTKGKLSCEKMPAQHTPTPWDYSGEFIKTADNKTIIAEVRTGDDICHDSEFIVRAVNAYDANQKTIAALLEAAKRIVYRKDGAERPIGAENANDRDALKEAIAQAEGKS